jgi:Undecaprenyl pyrophosphate synthetase (EC 2.5.1.31)
MRRRIRRFAERCYERSLLAELSETPSHVAIIQDGNRRYATERGQEPTDGHRAGAETSEQLLRWCDELDIEEVTLYTFSTENFSRSAEEREELFDLVTQKLRKFADNDRIREAGVRIRAVGETGALPERVQEAIAHAERRTADNEQYQLNVALAYGGGRNCSARRVISPGRSNAATSTPPRWTSRLSSPRSTRVPAGR